MRQLKFRVHEIQNMFQLIFLLIRQLFILDAGYAAVGAGR
jgi:hypothetical protein